MALVAGKRAIGQHELRLGDLFYPGEMARALRLMRVIDSGQYVAGLAGYPSAHGGLPRWFPTRLSPDLAAWAVRLSGPRLA